MNARARAWFVVLSLLAVSQAAPVAAQQPQRARPPLNIPDSLTLESDVQYGKAGDRALVLDVLRPKELGDQRRPAVVFIHGGGWRAGNKTAGLGGLVPVVTQLDAVGFSVGYRLSGEAIWPAQVHDCKAALRWIRASADKYQVDPDRVALWGPSAGGHLVSLLGTSSDVSELDGENGSPGQSVKVTCVVDYCGPSNFLTFFDNKPVGAGATGPISELFGGPVAEHQDAARLASPVTHVSKDDPPFLIVHGTEDPLVPIQQAEELHHALLKAGCDSTFLRLIGAGHGLGGPDLNARVLAFLNRHLKGAEVAVSSEPIIQTPMPATVAEGAKLEAMYVNDRFFEGPTWDPEGKRLYFTAFDKQNTQVLRLEPAGEPTVWLDKSEGVNGTFLARDGRMLGAQAYGHRVLSFALGGEHAADTKVLLEDSTLNQPNDICQTPDGTIYFTDPDFKNRQTSAVYRLTKDGKAQKVISDMTVPNGLIASLDGRTLYVGDSHEKHWRAYPIAADGTLGEGKLFFEPKTLDLSPPDGMTIDADGTLYFAGRGGVWVVRPSGESLGVISVPEFCSNVTFGGDDGRTLYLTCRGKVYSLAMRVAGGRNTAAP